MTETEKRPKRRLSALEFERATNNMRMSTELKVASYRYMVDHWTFKETADASGLNDRSIQRSVRKIWEEHTNHPPLPPGWVTELVSLPQEEMARVKEYSKSLIEDDEQ